MSDFQAGDRVVCVDAAPHYFDDIDGPPLVEGRVYRVSKVLVSPDDPIPGLLVEGVDPDDPYEAFCSTRFRKLNDEADDLALIERIKGKQPIPTLEPVTVEVARLNLDAWPAETRAEIERINAEYDAIEARLDEGRG